MAQEFVHTWECIYGPPKMVLLGIESLFMARLLTEVCCIISSKNLHHDLPPTLHQTSGDIASHDTISIDILPRGSPTRMGLVHKRIEVRIQLCCAMELWLNTDPR